MNIIKEPEPKASNFKKSPSGLWTPSSMFLDALDAKTTENDTKEKEDEKKEIKSKELDASETASD